MKTQGIVNLGTKPGERHSIILFFCAESTAMRINQNSWGRTECTRGGCKPKEGSRAARVTACGAVHPLLSERNKTMWGPQVFPALRAVPLSPRVARYDNERLR